MRPLKLMFFVFVGLPAYTYSSPFSQVRSSVVQISASQCSGSADRSASGFLFRDRFTIITAFHVIQSCSHISAYSESRLSKYELTVERVLPRADLALLRADRQLSATPIPLKSSIALPNENLLAVGYLLGAPTLSDRALRVASGPSRLIDMLPPAVAKRVAQGKVPDLKVGIIRIDGTLVPGMSGAPIIDDSGSLAGVADGGLDGGAVAISWGINALNMHDLLESTQTGTSSYALNPELFSLEDVKQNISSHVLNSEEIQCGSLSLVKSKGRPLSVLHELEDDPRSGQKLMDRFGILPSHASALLYDLWTEPQSGGTVALPAGTQLESFGSSGCYAHSDYITLNLIAINATSIADQEIKLRSFLSDSISKRYRDAATVDGSSTYRSAKVLGKDNLTVDRKAFYVNDIAHGYVAYTVMTRANILIASVVSSGILAPDSNHNLAAKVVLGQYLVGLHVSTFPPM